MIFLNFLKDESGQTIVIGAAFMALVAMGVLAFALDVGLLFRERRMAQSAADAAALAAAAELAAGYPANEQAAANAMAQLNGFNPTLKTDPATVTLSTPATGNFTGSSYVQATVSRPISTLFLHAFNSKFATLTVGAQAIAGGAASSPTCVCLEGASGEDLNLSNSSQLSASGCGVVDNSSSSNAVGIVGSSTLGALSLGTVSTTWDNSNNINNGGSITAATKIVQGITTKCAPTLPAAPTYSNCLADPGGSYGTFTFGPSSASGVICYNALTIGANGSTCTLNPGTYVITGELHFESGANGYSNLGGNGVFFYLTSSASLVIDNGVNTNLVAGGAKESGGATAPTVGVYNGLLFYQVAADTTAVTIEGGSTTYINGSFYAPGAALTIGNGSGGTVDGGIVAASLTMNGGATLNAVALTNEGSLVTGSAKMVQ